MVRSRLSGLVAVLGLAAGLATAGDAHAALVYGFEDAAVPGNSAGTLVPQSTDNVTQGTYSLGIQVTGGWFKALELWEQNYADVVKANDKVLIDVTVPNVGTWASLEFGFYGDGQGGWQSMPATTGSIFPGATQVTLEYVYDGSSLVPPGDNPSWWNLLFIYNGDQPAGTTIHVDNLRFEAVPEPASLALLGLGGVAMLRRRGG